MHISAINSYATIYPQPVPHKEQDGFELPSARTEQHKADDTVANTDDRDSRLDGLSEEEAKEVEKLKARDREVRAHEQAHLAAAAGLAMSGASYTYERGPDGVSYAVGGEVKIDTSPGSSPEETIRRAQTVRAAALAPAEPSGQDRAVAAKAAAMEAEARGELAAEQSEQSEDEPSNSQDPKQAQNQVANHERQLQQYYRADMESGTGSLLNLTA